MNISDYNSEINLLVQPYISANKKIAATEAKKIIKRTENGKTTCKQKILT